MPSTDIDQSRYVFDNDNVHSMEQHRCLAAAYDPLTTRRLAQTRLTRGWRCLEVGAGGGSVARWLAGRVAPTGRVLATDIKPHHIARAPGLTVRRHDVVVDPLPEAEFDLVHAPLVLLHLPRRIAALHKLVRALKPGGWLQLDEFDISYGPCLRAPSPAAKRLYERFLEAKAAVMASAGADGQWGRKLAGAMRDARLLDIDVHPQLDVWHAGSPGLELLVHHTFHLRDQLVAVGMTDDELADVRAVLRDPAFIAVSCAIYSVRGRREPR